MGMCGGGGNGGGGGLPAWECAVVVGMVVVVVMVVSPIEYPGGGRGERGVGWGRGGGEINRGAYNSTTNRATKNNIMASVTYRWHLLSRRSAWAYALVFELTFPASRVPL